MPRNGPWYRRKLADHAREPFWSPDGQRIGWLPQVQPQSGDRGDPSKAGTFVGSCGLVGVHAEGWNLCAGSAEREGVLNLNAATDGDCCLLATNGCSKKEPAWFRPHRQAGEYTHDLRVTLRQTQDAARRLWM